MKSIPIFAAALAVSTLPSSRARADGPHAVEGLTITPTDKGARVTDTVGGFQIDFPSTPQLEKNAIHVHKDDSDRPGAMATLAIGDSGVTFAVIRLKHSDYDPRQLNHRYDLAVAREVAQGYRATENTDTTLAGMPARHYIATGTYQHVAITIDSWIAVSPKSDTDYEIVTVHPTDQALPPELAAVAGTFRAAGK
jgi:hypothetical protein